MRHLGLRTCFQIEQTPQRGSHIGMFSCGFSCFPIRCVSLRSGTSHSGSQKRDFCRRLDGKLLSQLDSLKIDEFLEVTTMLLAYMEVQHPHTLPVVCLFTKGPSDGLFSTAPLYFNYLFAAPTLYLVWSTKELSNLPKRLGNQTSTGWLDLGMVLVQQS